MLIDAGNGASMFQCDKDGCDSQVTVYSLLTKANEALEEKGWLVAYNETYCDTCSVIQVRE